MESITNNINEINEKIDDLKFSVNFIVNEIAKMMKSLEGVNSELTYYINMKDKLIQDINKLKRIRKKMVKTRINMKYYKKLKQEAEALNSPTPSSSVS